MKTRVYLAVLVYLTFFSCSVLPKKSEPDKKPDWAKKDIRDMDDADMERLLDQWEVSTNNKQLLHTRSY